MVAATQVISMPLQLGKSRLLSSRWLWCFLAVTFVAGRSAVSGFSGLFDSLGDTDDATRLVQVRELLAGASWFDTTLNRIGGPQPLLSHWSRLIDAPLALLLFIFQLFFSMATAELIVRVVWPTLLLAVFLRLMIRELEFRTDVRGVAFFLILAVSCFSGLFQFSLGRIDHHSVMIGCTIVGSLALLRITSSVTAAIEAGLLLGLGLAVGFEALAIVVPLLALAGVVALLNVELRDEFARFGWMFAATLAGAFLVTVAPSQWFTAYCDALSLNIVVLSVGAAVGLSVLARVPREMPAWKILPLVSVPIILGVAAYGALDAKCLAGPFGQVEPGIKPIWLDNVIETFNFVKLSQSNPLAAIVFILTQLFGLIAAVYVLKRGQGDLTYRSGVLALVVISTVGGLLQAKLIPYSAWFALVAVVLAIGNFREGVQVSKLSLQLLAALIVNQSLLGLVSMQALARAGVPEDVIQSKSQGDTAICRSTPVVSTLSALPAGLIVAPIDFGPFAVALTHHRVLAAPYHRIGQSILTTHGIIDGDRAHAEQKLRSVGADYLVLCMPDKMADGAGSIEFKGDSLQTLLLSGGSVPYLEKVQLPIAAKTIRAWKVLPKS